jgi:hypothetical protein
MDPLRPFTNLLRSLWTGSTRSAARSDGARRQAPGSGAQQAQATAAAAPVTARLQARLATLHEWNNARARELFVEHVLLMEFGGDLARDPTFADLVRRVSTHLGASPMLADRLDQLLQAVAADRPPP